MVGVEWIYAFAALLKGCRCKSRKMQKNRRLSLPMIASMVVIKCNREYEERKKEKDVAQCTSGKPSQDG